MVGITLLSQLQKKLTYRPVAPHPDYPETAEIEEYVPAIFIPNLTQLNPLLQPVISPNIEVSSLEDESIDDNIVSWYYSESGELNEIILSEETSLLTSNPLFLLDNAVTTLETKDVDEDFTPLNLDRDSSNVNNSNQKTSLSFASYEHSIESNSYRYEPWTSGKSEFAVNAYRLDPSGNVHWIYDPSGTKVISEIKKSEIGTIRYVWSHHADNWTPWADPVPWVNYIEDNNMVFWNTFERDWNRSDKPLGACDYNKGSTVYLTGRRKYSSEWYAWMPHTAEKHYTRFSWIYNDWAHWNNSWKSKFRLWRIGS